MQNKTEVDCICHGISGTCTVTTCYKKVPNIEEIGQQLLTKYDAAKHESDNNQLMLNESSPSSSKLTYCKVSPNFCERDLKNGIYGSSGRQCWLERQGPSSCSEMCCGNPVQEKQVIQDLEQCEFVWCCSIKCKVVGQYNATAYFCK